MVSWLLFRRAPLTSTSSIVLLWLTIMGMMVLSSILIIVGANQGSPILVALAALIGVSENVSYRVFSHKVHRMRELSDTDGG